MKKRTEISLKLSEDLCKFDSNLNGKFMCPVCSDIYEARDKVNITDAHIIPEAAGGKLLTLLCRSCNSIFGSNQDKWFGEYLNVVLGKGKTVLSAKTKSKYVNINGESIRGDIKEMNGGDIHVYLYENHNPPGKLDALKLGASMTMSFKIPLSEKTKLIEIGYLTAAYLMWFKQLGYSWAMQSHLKEIKEQIQNPNKSILENIYMIDISEHNVLSPWIGVLDIGDNAYPCAAIFDNLVVFPTFSDRSPYETIQGIFKKTKNVEFHSLNVSNAHNHVGPMVLAYKNTMLVAPDIISSGKLIAENVLFFPNSKDSPHWLKPVSKEKYDKLKSDKNIQTISHKVK